MNRPLRRERDGKRTVAKRLPIIFRPWETVVSQIHAKMDKLALVAAPIARLCKGDAD